MSNFRPAGGAAAPRSPLPAPRVYAVILVGGKGKRLRPLSTGECPKAFLSVTKDRKTMFAATVARVSRFVPKDRIIVVAQKRHASLVMRDFPSILPHNLILEPASRNTAPAIALAATLVSKRDPDSAIVIIPTDHYIPDVAPYLRAIRTGIDHVLEHRNAIVVFGLKPTYPATGFGYIRVKEHAALPSMRGNDAAGRGIHKVERFTEKPDLYTAKHFMIDRRYLWNTGAFVFTAGTILHAISAHAPEIAFELARFGAVNIQALYKNMPDISIDYAVMEHSRNIWCVAARYRWDDMGSFAALKDVLRREGRKFTEKGDAVTAIL